MKYKLLLALAIIAYFLAGSWGCANIIPPSGGPRDSLPPILITAVPKDSMYHFKGNRITFTFNEYVELQNTQENIVVSPTPKVTPIFESKLRTVTVRLKDTLEENTTYAIDFGNSLRDINEGNVLRNFTYVFTTGDTLYNYTLSGKVLLAETGKPDSTLIAMLHRSGEDSAVAKERPRYYTKLDSSGRFQFRFLAPGTYYLYTLKDESGMKLYTSPAQLFGFASEPVVVSDSASPAVTLYAYVEEEEQQRPTTTRTPAPKTKKEKEEDKRLKFQLNLENGQQDLLGDLVFTFPDSLKTFDSSKVVFTDEEFTPITQYTLTPDTTGKIYTLRYPWKENTAYHLILDKEFASDTLDRMLLKTDTVDFRSKKESDYGSVRLRFTNVQLDKKPVVQLVENGRIIYSSALTGSELYTKLFKPGEYDIRILYDANGNGVWDPGRFFGEHVQPEKVDFIDQKLKIRANWDNEMNITLSDGNK
mgnify:CR=1 FL=1